MDIGAVKATIIDLEILHPGTGRPTGLVFELTSIQDERVKKAVRANADARIARRGQPPSPADLEREEINTAMAATIGWRWEKDGDGNQSSFEGDQLEFTTENLRKVLSTQWLRDQVEVAYMDVRRFFMN